MITFIFNGTEVTTDSLRKAALVIGVNVSSLSRYLSGKTRPNRKLKEVLFIHPTPLPYFKKPIESNTTEAKVDEVA